MTARPTCPHCNAPLRRWATPAGGTWDSPFLWVCFNDACSYYVRGWAFLEERFGRKASYRHSRDPQTGSEGPLPVWSADALTESILPDESGDQ